MRVLVVGITVVASFVVGVWAIARSTPTLPDWLRLTLAMLWMCAVIAAAFVFGNERRNEPMLSRYQLRDGFLYLLISSVLVAGATAVAVHDADAGIHRNIKESWFVGIPSAVLVAG